MKPSLSGQMLLNVKMRWNLSQRHENKNKLDDQRVTCNMELLRTGCLHIRAVGYAGIQAQHVATLILWHQNGTSRQSAVLSDFANDESLLRAIAAPSASTARQPIVVWGNGESCFLIHVVTMSAKVLNVVLLCLETSDEIRRGVTWTCVPEVVCR